VAGVIAGHPGLMTSCAPRMREETSFQRADIPLVAADIFLLSVTPGSLFHVVMPVTNFHLPWNRRPFADARCRRCPA